MWLQDFLAKRNLPMHLPVSMESHQLDSNAPDCQQHAVGEMVAWVDERNEDLGAQSRVRVRSEGLRHRASYIFVFNHNTSVLLQRRSHQKDLYPGWYDACAGGVLRVGESYATNAQREVFEELGISDGHLELRDEFYFEQGLLRVFGASFVVMHEGPFTFTDAEVEWAQFVPIEGVLKGAYEPLTPDSAFALRRLCPPA